MDETNYQSEMMDMNQEKEWKRRRTKKERIQ
jgi:hypothetical protein